MSVADVRRGSVGRRPRPMRVLMTTDAVGGVWQYSLDLAAGLRERGAEVRLAVLGPPPSPTQRDAARRAEIPVDSFSCRLEWMDDPWTDVSRAGDWLEGMTAVWMPDVLHLNGFCHAARGWPVPVVVVAHSCVCSWWRAVHGVAAPPSLDEYRRRVRAGLRAATCVVAPSNAMRSALGVEYGPIGDVHVIPNGCGAGRGSRVVEKAPFIFSAGRLWDAAKNVDALREVAADVGWPVYVAGDAAPEAAGERSEAARYLGRLEPPQVLDWMSRAAVYAHPARYEPFGLSILEAANAGCALVLGDIPSLRENWTDAAMFVPPADRGALRAALQALIDDGLRRTRLAAQAWVRAERFRVPAMASAYFDLYCRAGAAPHAGGLASRES